MFDHRHYVPILKGKAGEYRALARLMPEVRNGLTPLIEIPPIEHSAETDQPLKTLDEHLKPVSTALVNAWPVQRPFFVDVVYLLDSGLMSDGSTHPATHLFADLREQGLLAIPVSGLARDEGYQNAIGEIIQADDRGVCLRLEEDDFADPDSVEPSLGGIMSQLGAERGSTDLLIDFGPISTGHARRLALQLRTMLQAIPNLVEWRSLTVAGSSFPPHTGDMVRGEPNLVERTEWLMWLALRSGSPHLRRLPTFSDYAINHPTVAELDWRVIKMNANIRYTTDEAWLIFKGRPVRVEGYEQSHQLCASLVEHESFLGEEYSPGDTWISCCARSEEGPGNATTWREVATSHHLTFVTRQIASLHET
ncbi:MAG: beta family protein [Spirochaetales bacterium]|nr:beta family protein [Spirochaetales bacterium]